MVGRPAPGSVVDRFWVKVDRSGECWVWTACKAKGYGRFGIAPGVTRNAHRVSYEWLVGPIPDDLHLDHLCRNRACVRPDHLEPVTNAVNVLRGMAPNIVAARTNTCHKGHDLAAAYVRVRANGSTTRVCRVCATLWKRAARSRQEAAA